MAFPTLPGTRAVLTHCGGRSDSLLLCQKNSRGRVLKRSLCPAEPHLRRPLQPCLLSPNPTSSHVLLALYPHPSQRATLDSEQLHTLSTGRHGTHATHLLPKGFWEPKVTPRCTPAPGAPRGPLFWSVFRQQKALSSPLSCTCSAVTSSESNPRVTACPCPLQPRPSPSCPFLASCTLPQGWPHRPEARAQAFTGEAHPPSPPSQSAGLPTTLLHPRRQSDGCPHPEAHSLTQPPTVSSGGQSPEQCVSPHTTHSVCPCPTCKQWAG